MNIRSQIRGAKGTITRSQTGAPGLCADASIPPGTTRKSPTPAAPGNPAGRVIAFGDGTVVRYQSVPSLNAVKVEWKQGVGAARTSRRKPPYVPGAAKRGLNSGVEKQ